MTHRPERVRGHSLLALSGWAVCLGAALFVLTACASGDFDALMAGDTSQEADTQEADPHASIFLKDRYPSAKECRACHPDHYREWSVSPHSYAQVSPVFNAMHGKILTLMNGTTGDFCIRCHTPIGMTIGEPLFTSNLNRHPVSFEGITCIVCHRVNEAYGKVSGRRHLVTGPLTEPVFGPTGGAEVARVLAAQDEYRVTNDPGSTGRKIHGDAKKFFELTTPSFCGACHDVTLPNGFRLEEAFSEYKTSPAAGRGETCQDCHMSKDLGVASGFHEGPAAIVGGKPTRIRKRTHHMFAGPDHSVVHPGIYPHNPEAQSLATLAEWLTFDWKAGWGTNAFEDAVKDDHAFPTRWSDAEDRYEAREIIEGQLALLREYDAKRLELLTKGYLLGDVSVHQSDAQGLRFEVQVKNGTDGHNVPTGFTAERLVFLQVTVSDAAGKPVFQSGDLDPNGDVRDAHSVYVHNGELPQDPQLFSLQSRFITRMVRGGEREQILAVNQSEDPLPFLRPETFSSVLTGRPLGARIHKFGIEPGGHRTAAYSVPGATLRRGGKYNISVKLRAGMVPVNLVHAIQSVGFDYGMSPRAIGDAIVAGHLILAERTLDVTVN